MPRAPKAKGRSARERTASAHRKAAPRKPARATRGAPARPDVTQADPTLFAPLTEGEQADALRTLLEDERLRPMANVGRYRVIAVEPLVVKPPEPLAGRRLARIVIYDYASDRCVDACVDLDRGAVCHLARTTAQPLLSREEEQAAAAVASADGRTAQAGRPGGVLHYWSRRPSDLAYRRRSAAVVFVGSDGRPTVVAVVDLIDDVVTEVVPAEQW